MSATSWCGWCRVLKNFNTALVTYYRAIFHRDLNMMLSLIIPTATLQSTPAPDASAQTFQLLQGSTLPTPATRTSTKKNLSQKRALKNLNSQDPLTTAELTTSGGNAQLSSWGRSPSAQSLLRAELNCQWLHIRLKAFCVYGLRLILI